MRSPSVKLFLSMKELKTPLPFNPVLAIIREMGTRLFTVSVLPSDFCVFECNHFECDQLIFACYSINIGKLRDCGQSYQDPRYMKMSNARFTIVNFLVEAKL